MGHLNIEVRFTTVLLKKIHSPKINLLMKNTSIQSIHEFKEKELYHNMFLIQKSTTWTLYFHVQYNF